ncbi:MAG: ferrochelatase [Desulfobacterales bacterium]|jgi:ferrochelatase|nr:ferrochelatase [Desulfobacterales bacterium]
MNAYAVVLMNLGGPDSLESVEPFLCHLFSDPDIFRIPFGQRLFAKFISKRRAPKVMARYRQIGGKSPINEWTEAQRRLLQEALQVENPGARVYTAMRYWHPFIHETAEKVAADRFEKIVLLPLYPHYSITTTGSAFNEWKRVYSGDVAALNYVSDYFDHPQYIAAINERIDETIQTFPEAARGEIQIVFSAHGTPVRFVKEGDPYSRQIQKTVDGVMTARRHSHPHHLCFQSRVGPVKWLEPSTEKMIEKLATQGNKHLLIVPVSFVSDHIETLFELNVEYREVAERLGIETYRVMTGLNASTTFIAALKDIVLATIK